jgi:hypothetical protein
MPAGGLEKTESKSPPGRISLLLPMKTQTEANQTETPFSASTYAMILRAEDKRRNILETMVYSLLMLSAVIALLQFGHDSFKVARVATPSQISTITLTAHLAPPRA